MSDADTRAHRLAAALDDFIRSSPDVEAAAVVSFDGLPMASALPDELEEDRVGAMSAALLSLGEQAALGLGRGLLNQVFVEGEHGFVFLMSARDQAVLSAIASRSAKIGFMLFEMRRAADRIGRALEAGAPEVVAPEAAPGTPGSTAAPSHSTPDATNTSGPDTSGPNTPGPNTPGPNTLGPDTAGAQDLAGAPYASGADPQAAATPNAGAAPGTSAASAPDVPPPTPASGGEAVSHLGLVERFDATRASGA